MSSPEQAADQLASLDDDLRDVIAAKVPPGDIEAVAQVDLDQTGRYIKGCLVLTRKRIGAFSKPDGLWGGGWRELTELERSELIEGLGVKLLRLHADGKIVGDYRCSLRHAKELARLHRRLERILAGREEPDTAEPAAPPVEEGRRLRCEKCGRVLPPWSDFCPSCMCRRKVLSRLFDFIKPHKLQAALAALTALVLALVSLAKPALIRPMIDKGLGGDLGRAPNWSIFLFYMTVLAALVIVSTIGGGAQSRLTARLGAQVARDIRNRTYHHLHQLSLSFFSRKETGQLITRITTDSDRLWDFIAFTAVEMSTSILTIIGVAVWLFVMHWKLATFTLMPVPIMFFLVLFFHKRIGRQMRRMMFKWGRMTSVVASAIPGVRVIKAFNQEDREVDRFRERNEDVYNESVSIINLWTVFGPVMSFCTQLGILIVWVLGGWWIVQNWQYKQATGDPLEGGMTLGTLMAFQGFMGLFYQPIRQIAMMDRTLNRAATSAHRIFEILDTEPAIFSSHEARPADKLAGKIEVRDVSFSYDGVRRALKNISFIIEPGQMIGLAGPSGGGKTTLINLICRFYDVLEGQILIDGVDVRDYDLGQLRRNIGVVLQEPFLFHGTVAENIAYGNPDCALDEIINAARAANAHDFIVGFPDGYETVVGERGHTLSGGERQRISIARAIIHNPRILILDEATSSVDSETEKLIQTAIERLVENRTTIAIAHRLSTLRKADRLIILKSGDMIEQGTHDELASREGGLYAKLLSMQAETQAMIGLGGVTERGQGHGDRTGGRHRGREFHRR